MYSSDHVHFSARFDQDTELLGMRQTWSPQCCLQETQNRSTRTPTRTAAPHQGANRRVMMMSTPSVAVFRGGSGNRDDSSDNCSGNGNRSSEKGNGNCRKSIDSSRSVEASSDKSNKQSGRLMYMTRYLILVSMEMIMTSGCAFGSHLTMMRHGKA